MLFHGQLGSLVRDSRRRLLAAYSSTSLGYKVGCEQRSQAQPKSCRLVAQEVNTYRGDVFFAATPSVEALRLLFSHVATNCVGSHGGRNFIVLDARKAHLHAFAEREVYMELSTETISRSLPSNRI